MFFPKKTYNKRTNKTLGKIEPAVMKKKDQIDIDRLVDGDREQWQRFVKVVSPLVYSVLNKTLSSAGHSTENTKDLLQDVFLKLCRRQFQLLKRYDPGRSRLSTWVAVIARNMANDYLRRQRPATLSMDAVPEQKDNEPSEPDIIDIPFEMLPPRRMLIMRLLYEQEMTVREVAQILGIKEQTVRSARHKAIVFLRSHLTKKN